MKNYLIGFAVLISLLTSCKPSEMSADYLDEAVELAAVEVFSNSPYRASRIRTIDIIHTDLKVSFDWENQYLNGEATITLRPYFYATNKVVLDAIGMEIKSVSIKESGAKSSLNYTYENDVLTIDLKKEYSNTDTLDIMISYVAKPEERVTNSGSAVTDDKCGLSLMYFSTGSWVNKFIISMSDTVILNKNSCFNNPFICSEMVF